MGPLPPSGGWIRLEAPASAVDLDGRSINGMGFTLYGGRASWDYAGFIRPTGLQQPNDYDTDGFPDYLEDRNGNGVYDTGDLANWSLLDTDGDGLTDAYDPNPTTINGPPTLQGLTILKCPLP